MNLGENFEVNVGDVCVKSMQWNVEFLYQLSICHRTEKNYENPWFFFIWGLKKEQCEITFLLSVFQYPKKTAFTFPFACSSFFKIQVSVEQ